jgi:hypothetical protein
MSLSARSHHATSSSVSILGLTAYFRIESVEGCIEIHLPEGLQIDKWDFAILSFTYDSFLKFQLRRP